MLFTTVQVLVYVELPKMLIFIEMASVIEHLCEMFIVDIMGTWLHPFK